MKMTAAEPLRIIVSGGGTGGHIFPAISIANAIKEAHPEAEIKFVGALGRMEMQRVPAAGYEIEGLPVRGLVRPLWSPKNISVLMDFMKSKKLVKKMIRDFKPHVVVGVGGYASGPTLKAAAKMGIPTLLQEQNSYAGVTNKLLAKKARKICVAYDGMERFFPADKIVKTGNPVRQNLLNANIDKTEAVKSFGLDPTKRTVLIIGGSLGARTVNESILQHIEDIRSNQDVQFILQTGKYYSETVHEALAKEDEVKNLKVLDFIANMDEAYAAADLVVSRAGASSISELCLLQKPCILVPSPNVAEDHQTKNAMALSTKGAAILVRDADARNQLVPLAIKTVLDTTQLRQLGENAGKLAYHNSAQKIADEVFRLAEEKYL